MLRFFPAVLFLTFIGTILLLLSSFEGVSANRASSLEETPNVADAPAFGKGTVIIHRKDTPVRFTAEIASTTEQRKYGLMFRTSMPEMHAMLFVFGTPQIVNMWMMNTPLALDILFINSDNTITKIAENTTPQSLTLITSEEEVNKVLELNAGVVKKLGIAVGDRLEYLTKE